MNSKLVTLLVVPFMLAGVPLNRPADAQERFQDPVQQCDLNRKPSHDCLSRSDTARVKDNRPVQLRQQGSIRTLPLQGDLLQELLPPMDRNPEAIRMTNEKKAVHGIDYKIETQETGLLEELLAEAAMP